VTGVAKRRWTDRVDGDVLAEVLNRAHGAGLLEESRLLGVAYRRLETEGAPAELLAHVEARRARVARRGAHFRIEATLPRWWAWPSVRQKAGR
jgi:hypothetical protein